MFLCSSFDLGGGVTVVFSAEVGFVPDLAASSGCPGWVEPSVGTFVSASGYNSGVWFVGLVEVI